MFTSVETITDILIGPWLPFYNELKLLFLYMTYPTSDSSLTYVYRNIICPFYKRHEKNIDAQINSFKRGGLQTLMVTGKKCSNILLNLAMRVIQSYGLQIGPLQNINMNMTMIENSEPDGDINWDEVINNSKDDENSSTISLTESESEEPDYSFSNMYGTTQTKDNGITNDPPASNTRIRKKAP
jgi:receptor expression-enhancing protein 1/2/3/4